MKFTREAQAQFDDGRRIYFRFQGRASLSRLAARAHSVVRMINRHKTEIVLMDVRTSFALMPKAAVKYAGKVFTARLCKPPTIIWLATEQELLTARRFANAFVQSGVDAVPVTEWKKAAELFGDPDLPDPLKGVIPVVRERRVGGRRSTDHVLPPPRRCA